MQLQNGNEVINYQLPINSALPRRVRATDEYSQKVVFELNMGISFVRMNPTYFVNDKNAKI